MNSHGVIYVYKPPKPPKRSLPVKLLGLGMLALALGGLVGPLSTQARLEASYWLSKTVSVVQSSSRPLQLPKAVPVIFNPLKTEDGSSIDPINTEFSLIVPKIGINAAVIPAVNPVKPGEYLEALKKGVAHSSLSYFPDEEGTVYLFSHSTNYEWFVGDLNAVFYLLKNLSEGDLMVVYYKGTQYTYKLTEKRIVKPTEVSYLIPQSGKKRLILQTCWPPGSTTERLLIFADLIEEQSQQI